jgi:SAM-dependent methyltransferase
MTWRIEELEDKTTATAYSDWNERWKTDEGRNKWLAPEVEVETLARFLLETGARRTLDLGCGVGRHSLFLASSGFFVVALDASEAGIAFARASKIAGDCNVSFLIALMTEFPLAESTFDYLLAWNVIYHGNRIIVEHTLGEIRRVLRPGGFFQGTMLSKRNRNYRQGREISPETFVLDGATDDKAHPHFYCDAVELESLFAGFDLLRLTDCEREGPGSNHWHFVAKRV